MKSFEDMTEEVMGSSNNWKRMHGYVMHRFKAYGNRRRRASQRERVCLPFPNAKDLRKKRRFKTK